MNEMSNILIRLRELSIQTASDTIGNQERSFANKEYVQLVDEIESYPSFMEGCVGAQVLHRDDQLVEARLDLARGGIQQSFSTRNRLRAHQAIELELLEGPFETFRGRWQFQALGDDST